MIPAWGFSSNVELHVLSLLHKSDFRLRILCKSRHHRIHLAPLGVLLSRPPDKRTLLSGPRFSKQSFYLFLPRCAMPDKRTYRNHGCTYTHHTPAGFFKIVLLVWGFSSSVQLGFLSLLCKSYFRLRILYKSRHTGSLFLKGRHVLLVLGMADMREFTKLGGRAGGSFGKS